MQLGQESPLMNKKGLRRVKIKGHIAQQQLFVKSKLPEPDQLIDITHSAPFFSFVDIHLIIKSAIEDEYH